MIPNGCIEVHISPLDRPTVPAWFAEVVMIARHLATEGLLETFARAEFACTIPICSKLGWRQILPPVARPHFLCRVRGYHEALRQRAEG